MKMNAYYVKNTLSKLSDGIMLFPTDAFAVSQVVKKLNLSGENLNEYELHSIGIFDTESSVFTTHDDTLISFSSRSVVETPPVDTDSAKIVDSINSVR